MANFEKILSGDDLRSIGNCNAVIEKIKNENDFDELFSFLFHHNRVVVMHAADAIEKITMAHPQRLTGYKKKLLTLFFTAKNKELKWHLALMIPRLHLSNNEFEKMWNALKSWANDKTNSRLVRVAAVQGLFEMAKLNKNFLKDLNLISRKVEKENIPSINARIRNIRKEIQEEE